MKIITDRYNIPATIDVMDVLVETGAFGSHTIYAVDEVPTIYGHIVQTLEEYDALAFCYEEPEMMHTVLRKAMDFLLAYTDAFEVVGAHGIVMAEPLGDFYLWPRQKDFHATTCGRLWKKTEKTSSSSTTTAAPRSPS